MSKGDRELSKGSRLRRVGSGEREREKNIRAKAWGACSNLGESGMQMRALLF
jgi:hypothetical protein